MFVMQVLRLHESYGEIIQSNLNIKMIERN